jgi:hypothetical protein
MEDGAFRHTGPITRFDYLFDCAAMDDDVRGPRRSGLGQGSF